MILVEEENKKVDEQKDIESNEKKQDNNKEKIEKEKKSLFKKKEDLEKKKLEDENKLLNDKILRVSAEMQNMMKRNEERVANLLKYEGEDLIKKILPSIDNFERAINMNDANSSEEVKNFINGFKIIYNSLVDVLKNQEVEEIDCLDQPFDPNTMEAVLVEEKEGTEPDIVIDVLQKGYTYKGKVIRHAMVKVSK